MYMDQGFCIAKLGVDTTVWGEEKTISFTVLSQQYPKWDSSAKASPKAI